ncbi:hypothetical protein F5B20DRAFT_534144 [Whalleya microplaca]|nr:hypothetical protein F5B20DRAFT_534144 [Whalleya microplaca]
MFVFAAMRLSGQTSPCSSLYLALVRTKDISYRGWEDVRARYYEKRPSPTPTRYMRKSTLLALATHLPLP